MYINCCYLDLKLIKEKGDSHQKVLLNHGYNFSILAGILWHATYNLIRIVMPVQQ